MHLKEIAETIAAISTIGAAIVFMYRTYKELMQIREGVKCGMRSDMLRTYYRHREDKTIRQYELENFLMLYSAYTALGGNSFIHEIHQDVTSWEIIS